LSSGVASDPKDSKSFPSYEGKSFSKILYKFIYETEIVTFQKILMIVKMLMLYSSEGGTKDKTDY
jgi:hypothetical protein